MSAMATKQVIVDLPDELWQILGKDERALSARLREALVVDLVRRSEISAGHAAQLLGMDLVEFAELMAAHGLPVLVEPSLPHVVSKPPADRPKAEARTLAAIGLQQRGYISIREAARHLGLSYEGYLDLLWEQGYPVDQGRASEGDTGSLAGLAGQRYSE